MTMRHYNNDKMTMRNQCDVSKVYIKSIHQCWVDSESYQLSASPARLQWASGLQVSIELQGPKAARSGCCKAWRSPWGLGATWGQVHTKECQFVVMREREKKERVFLVWVWSLQQPRGLGRKRNSLARGVWGEVCRSGFEREIEG